ncbi:hypothetical protein MKX03_003177, partial [Papaver bracteatum]
MSNQALLEESYRLNAYPSTRKELRLSTVTGLSRYEISHWFIQRRCRGPGYPAPSNL